MEKKLKKIQQSKDTISKDEKKEPYSLEKKDSKVSEDIKTIESNSKEKKNKERDSLEFNDSIDLSGIEDDDDDYGVEKESLEKLYKRHKHRRKKRKRYQLRNYNKKFKTNHKHRKVHKRHRHNKHKKHHKHRHKKHHKYRYLLLEGLRRGNIGGRSDLYSVEFMNKDNTSHSIEKYGDISRTSSEIERDSEDNKDYQSLRKKSMGATMLGRNTRFYIVKNVRSTERTTSEQPETNNWSYHKRFNIVGNNENRNMTIISASLDIDKKKPTDLTVTNEKVNNTNEFTVDLSSSSSSSSTESSDGLPIDKWVPHQEAIRSIPTKTSRTLLTISVKPNSNKKSKEQDKRKRFSVQQNLDDIDVRNDTDYLSRNQEVIFSDWLRTVDRVRFTPPLDNRKSYNKIKSTVKFKDSTNNVKSMLFFKASDEYDSSPWLGTSSGEQDIFLRSNKQVTRRNNYINTVTKSSEISSETIITKSSFELSLENKEMYMNQSRKRPKRTKPVDNRKIRKTTKVVQSHEEGLVKNLAKQFQVLEKINKNFDKAKTTNMNRDVKHNSTQGSQELGVDKHSDLDVWMPGSGNDYEADNESEDSRESHQETDLKNKQITSYILPATTSTRKTTDNVKQMPKITRDESSIEESTLAHRTKNTGKIVVKDNEYEPLPHYSNILTTTDQTNVNIIKLQKKTVILNQRYIKSSTVVDDKLELMSDEEHNSSEEAQFVTNIIRRNNRIENLQRRFSNNISTTLPKKIRMKIFKKLSEMRTDHTLRRQNKKRFRTFSESSDEEGILKSNIYKYFGDNEKMKREHDEFNRSMSYRLHGDNFRSLDGIEPKNDTVRRDTIVELD